MEECIVICSTDKVPDRRGKILMINTLNEVTRKNALSWLGDAHVSKLADAYESFESIDGLAEVITIAVTGKNNCLLLIQLYVNDIVAEQAYDPRS